QTQGRASGKSQYDLVSSLNGDGAVTFSDGAYEGFDLAGTLRNVGSLGVASGGERPKTDFTELGGSFTITDGLLQNRDLKMLAPLVRVNGAGDVPLPPQTLDYKVEARLVSSLQGQGGEEAIAGLPIPVHAKGPWNNLTFNIDWASVFQAAALDPERLAAMPDDMKGLAENFGVAIPGLGGSGDGGAAGAIGGAVQGILGGGTSGGSTSGDGGSGDGGAAGALGGALNQLLGGGTGDGSTAGESGSGDGAAEEEQPAEQKKKPKVDPGKLLKSLF
ncbi:MAG: AsmA-like C-terminal region-containing protein, partial [Kiloniellales bacterium]|nr:AsmA-like C-terminal region-containing protein [Kiloniellales bacterium]